MYLKRILYTNNKMPKIKTALQEFVKKSEFNSIIMWRNTCLHSRRIFVHYLQGGKL